MWDEFQMAALDQIGLKDASNADRAVFLHQCQRTGLDPFSRQIYMIGRNEKMPGTQNQWRVKYTIQTGIEGWRVIRDRAERREGVRGKLSRAIWYDEDNNEYKVWVRREPPAACELTYTVRDANGVETEYTSVLQFWEYAQTKEINGQVALIAQWAVKKSHMLEKCTEADVYRKAFPQDFAGVVLDDAMPADTSADGERDTRPRGRVTAGEVMNSRPAAEDDTRSQPRGADSAPAPGGAPSTARNPDPRAAGAAPDRGAQPPPPQDGPPEDQPGSVSAAQLTRLHTVLTGLGFGGEDREQKLVIAKVITGHDPLTGPEEGRTSKNLSLSEARKLIDTLDGFADRDALIAHMAERKHPAGE